MRGGGGGGSDARAMLGEGCAFLLLAALAALAASRPDSDRDRDFEFDDDALQELRDSAPAPAAARHRFELDPHSALCRGVACGAGQRCVLRDRREALCVTHDTVNALDDALNAEDDADVDPDRCVQCEGAARAAVCGSDNRTYASLCALDLRNCRARSRVAPRCHRPCPCEELSLKPHRRPHRDDAAGCAWGALGERLLAWFSVLQGAAPPPRGRGFPRDCKPEVRWMFEHLDSDRDGLLSDDNLYALEHDEGEKCLRPFLRRCARASRAAGTAAGGAAGDATSVATSVAGGGVSRRGWCACMRGAARPCAAMQRKHKAAAASGGWVPACDARGYFLPRQCGAGRCWCVDRRGARRGDACLHARDLAELDEPALGGVGGGVGVGVGGALGRGAGDDAEDAGDDDDGSGHSPLL